MASSSAAPADGAHGGRVAEKDGGAAAPLLERGLNCPRCDSANTKFCYYNNYSLAQPRYFCKTCRRYWTKGGALRNVPVGGGCRKRKKTPRSSSSSDVGRPVHHQELGFYHPGLPHAGEHYHPGGAAAGLPFTRLHLPPAPVLGAFFAAAGGGAGANHLISFGDLSRATSAPPEAASATTAAPVVGFSYPIQAVAPPTNFTGGAAAVWGGRTTVEAPAITSMHHSSLAASIESLSSINQSLHWKLQQQRLALLLGGDQNLPGQQAKVDGDVSAPASLLEQASCRPVTSRETPAISQQILVPPVLTPPGGGDMVSEKRSAAANGSATTGRFLENAAPYTAGGGLKSSSGGTDGRWSGVPPTWNDMHQFGAPP